MLEESPQASTEAWDPSHGLPWRHKSVKIDTSSVLWSLTTEVRPASDYDESFRRCSTAA